MKLIKILKKMEPQNRLTFWLNQNLNQVSQVSRTTEVVFFLTSLDFTEKSPIEGAAKNLVLKIFSD